MSNPKNESVNLHNTQGGSDKVYHVQLIEDSPDLYLVNFQYGRRGSSLATGEKLGGAAPYVKAKKVYDQLVASKVKGGYAVVGSSTSTMQSSPINAFVQVNADALPQLLNDVIDRAHAERLINDPSWHMQQKMNGERRPILVSKNSAVVGFNRTGGVIAIPLDIEQFFSQSRTSGYSFDGEMVGDKYYIFDLMDADSLRPVSFASRMMRLETMFIEAQAASPNENVILVKSYKDAASKRAAFIEIESSFQEGVVFKLSSSMYVVGRPNSGGDQLRYKFWASATVRVTGGRDGKRSVSISVRSLTSNQVDVGNVTVPANQAIPEIDQFIEVRYQYYFSEGSLFQPTLIGLRPDKNVEDFLHTLRYKPADLLAA